MRCCIHTLLLVLGMAACNHPARIPIVSQLERDSLAITTQSLQIHSVADVLELKSYYLSSFFDFGAVQGVMAYNYRLHSLDLISLGDCRIFSSIPLQKEGPDGISGEISGICPVSGDSIWVYDGISMYLVDSLGHVCNRFAFENKDAVVIASNHAMCTARFSYNRSDASLLYLVDGNSFFVEKYDVATQRVVHRYPLSSSIVNPARDRVYGDMDCPNVSFANGKIIYNYPYESHVYVLDTSSEQLSVIDAGSAYTSNHAATMTSQKYADWERHRVENVHFFDVMYLAEAKKYVRLHVNGVPFQVNQSLPTLMDSRSLYLSVFDEGFQTMGEVKLSDKCYNLCTGWCSLPNGVLIFKENILSDAVDDENLCLDVIVPD